MVGRPMLVWIVALLAATEVKAQGPAVGDEAPPFESAAWGNLAKGSKEPTNKGLVGRVVLLEFWGTWCAPCVRAMPAVQALHEAHVDRGLTVLAISYEPIDVINAFAQKGGYTFALGSDPARRVIEAFGVSKWPTSVVIGVDGKIAHVGDPYDAEGAVERALGLKTDPLEILTDAVDALSAKDDSKTRDALRRIADKSSMDVDLRKWAIDAGGSPTGPGVPPKSFAPDATLDVLVKSRAANDAAKSKDALELLATHAPTTFDAAAWAKRAYRREFPIGKKEMADLLAARRYVSAIDALCLSPKGGDAAKIAAEHKGLRAHAATSAAAARAEGRKGLMIQAFVVSGREPKNNKAFWSDLSVSGMVTAPDRKSVAGVILGDTVVSASNARFFIDLRFARAVVCEALAAGKEPKSGAALRTAVDQDRDRVAAALEKQYGGGA